MTGFSGVIVAWLTRLQKYCLEKNFLTTEFAYYSKQTYYYKQKFALKKVYTRELDLLTERHI